MGKTRRRCIDQEKRVGLPPELRRLNCAVFLCDARSAIKEIF
jgi:hypothetical protein